MIKTETADDKTKTPETGTDDLATDMKAMGLTEGEIKSLALSIETGQVHSEYETIDSVYGADPRLSDIAKQRRKTGLDSLSKLLDSKDGRGVMTHFSSLIRDLNTDGRTRQVSIITAWLMEIQEVYADNDAALCSYVKDYLRRYRGRAFPVKFDFALFAKSIGSARS